MIIKKDRIRLDESLNDTTTTVFLLVGQENSKAGEVHGLIESRTWDDWQHWFLITDSSLLAKAEIQAWFDGNTSEYYAVIGGEKLPKAVAQQGQIMNLLNKDGQPDYLKIRDAFLAGDEL